MDLQAILDATDSSSGDGGEQSSVSEGGDSSNVDLERILRDEDEDRNETTSTSHSTISTNAHHFPVARKNTVTSYATLEDSYFYSGGGSRYTNTGSHNAEDWAVLQQILGEDDNDAGDSDEDDALAWIHADRTTPQPNFPSANYSISEKVDVDAILNSINSYDELEFDGLGHAFETNQMPPHTPRFNTGIRHNTLSSNGTRDQYASPAEASADTPVMTGSKTSLEPLSHKSSRDEPHQLLNDVLLTRHSLSNDSETSHRMHLTDDVPVPDEAASEKALAHAQAYERRLLRPGHRDIVSPLMVKRRMKPRLELGSRMQMKEQEKFGKATSSVGAIQTPYFGFSGVMENKIMPGISTHLLKNSQEKSKDIGLPTALSVNSKFIAIGTQRGVILVFDLFEVLRQQLGRVGVDSMHHEGSWNAAQGGSVTSIDIAMNGETLIAGYTSGILVLWDIIKGTILKSVTDSHPSPITAVRFLSERDVKVVTVDAGGLVNKLTFSKNILWSAYSLDTECLLDGTAGQILSMNVLPSLSSVYQLPKDASPSSSYLPYLQRLVLIALSSERSSFAVAVEPDVSVLHRWSRPPDHRIQPKRGDDSSQSTATIHPDQPFLPCLSWGWALVAGGGNIVTPILARAWGCCVQLLRASFPTLEGAGPDIVSETMHWPAFGIHDEVDVPAPVVTIEWLGERSLVYLTLTNELVVLDTVMMTLTERLDFSGVKLVYAEFSLSRKASLDLDGQPRDHHTDEIFCSTFQNSIRSSDNRLLILCQDVLKSISILGTRQRISALEQDGEWLEALALALDHFETTIKSQEDRKRDPDGNRDLSRHPEFSSSTRSEEEEWIAKLLIRYLNLAVENAPEPSVDRSSLPATPNLMLSKAHGKLDLAQSHFQMLAGVCIEFCVVTRRLDLLFGPVFRRFHHVGYLSVFLDVLEPYVLNDKLDYLAPEAMAFFVEHCKATNGIATVERCLLHMDVTIMDFDSILSLLRRNEMYSALFYVFTRGLDDYIMPLEILLERIFEAADEGNALQMRRTDGVPQSRFELFGYKAILYLHHCFSGKTFPQGTELKPRDRLHTLRPQLLRFLQQEQYAPSGSFHASGSPIFGHRALSFPYTRILLLVDARAMLDIISISLDAPDAEFAKSDSAFESIGGWEVEVGADLDDTSSRQPKYDTQGSSTLKNNPDRQQIISMLSSIILPDDMVKSSVTLGCLRQSKAATDAFLDFMAKYLLKGIVRANKSVTFLIFSRMVDRFVDAVLPQNRQSSQEQIIKLLTALPRNAYDPVDVLAMIESAGIHRAALVLHQEGVSSWHGDMDGMDRRSYHFRSVIDCYLEDSDPEFQREVFAYAKKECGGDGGSNSSSLQTALCAKLPRLIELDPILSAQLVAEIYIEVLDEIVKSLDSGDEGRAQFQFLHAIISGKLSKVDAVAGPVLNANLTMNHHQMYLELMSKLHPDMVYQYLSTHDNYRAEECLKLCQQYEIADASAYLLERMGNVSSALQLILQTLEGRMMGLKRTIRGMGTDIFRSSSSRYYLSDWNKQVAEVEEQQKKQERDVEGVKRILVVALDLCERNSGTSGCRSEQGSQLWFNVLDRLINAKGFLRLSKEQPTHAKVMAGVLSQLLQATMQRLVSSVPLPDLVRKVTTDHSGSRLGELREMIESLLSTYCFEQDVFTGAVNVMHHDIKKMKTEYRRLKMEGSRVMSILEKPLTQTKSYGKSLSESSLHRTLVLCAKGDACFNDGGPLLPMQETIGGFSRAIDRLRSRRESRDDFSHLRTPWDRGHHGLNLMPVLEQRYTAGESSEAVYSGERLIGVLGDADHYGSFL